MATKTITAMFPTRADAERAASNLVSQLGVSQSSVRVSPGADMTDTGYDASQPYKETGFFASLTDLFMPDEDRYAYAEGMRRGSVLLNASVEEAKLEQAADVLEHAGALDLDAQEASWRQTGWTGYDATAHGAVAAAAMPATTAPVAGNTDDTIKIVQERLVVGKRAAETGRVKVRAYVVERPVEETVSLHEETVRVSRQPVDRPATAADLANAFGERTIEAHAVSEEAVVAKEVRVVEEIGIRKDASDRVETIHDTVRETKVDVDDTTATVHPGTVHPGAAHGASVTGGSTGVVGAADRALNTNASGTNPAADAPDGTPGNPPGTMASRAVDKTLGTNISGANPTGKL